MSNTTLTEVHPHGGARSAAISAANLNQAGLNEDWLAVILGLAIFVLALASLVHADLIGWVVSTSVWSDFGQALGPVSKTYASLGGAGALIATYAALTLVLTAGAAALKADVRKFALAFTAVFWIAYASWIVGNYANFAAVTPAEQQKFGITWSLKLTNEGAYIFALIVGLIIANFLPRFAQAIQEAVRPELYIKIATVILGGFFAVTAAGKLSFASSLLLRGLAAIVEAYLIYWAVVYFHRAQMVRLLSGMVGAAGGGHLDLRDFGGDRDRRLDPGRADRAGAGLFACSRLRGDRSADPAFRGSGLACARAAGGRRLDGPCGQDGRRRGRGRRHHRIADLGQECGRGPQRSKCLSTFSSASGLSCWAISGPTTSM
jgi:hypothetical protein